MLTRTPQQTQQGFTLIELMIVVAVIAILAAIALPSYTKYVREARRVDGQSALHQLALAQEKFRSTNTAYTLSTSALSINTTSPDGHYSLTITAASATSFTAQAQAVTDSQKADCDPLWLRVANGVTATGPDGCWKK